MSDTDTTALSRIVSDIKRQRILSCRPPRRTRRTHGLSHHQREYRIWQGMINRCYDPRHRAYKNYGGRGIGVCDRWIESFGYFYSDMGPRPKGTSIDRIDNNGHYEPGNCRWATHSEQRRNTRVNRRITYQGQTKTVTEWAVDFGLDPRTLFSRLRKGQSPEEALTTPPHRYKSPDWIPEKSNTDSFDKARFADSQITEGYRKRVFIFSHTRSLRWHLLDLTHLSQTACGRFCIPKDATVRREEDVYVLDEIVNHLCKKCARSAENQQNPTEKWCRKCGTIKPLSEFYKDRARALGVTNSCKQCISLRDGQRKNHG